MFGSEVQAASNEMGRDTRVMKKFVETCGDARLASLFKSAHRSALLKADRP